MQASGRCVSRNDTLSLTPLLRSSINATHNDMIYFINCSWVATRWQQFSTHLHTNNTQKDTKQTIHRTTQKFRKSAGRAPSLRVLLDTYVGLFALSHLEIRPRRLQKGVPLFYTRGVWKIVIANFKTRVDNMQFQIFHLIS
jgi:hypothetical protein